MATEKAGAKSVPARKRKATSGDGAPKPALRLFDPSTLWQNAIARWGDNDVAAVLGLLDRLEIPLFARAWLKDAVLGKTKRRRGAPRRQSSFTIREYLKELHVRELYESELARAKRNDGRHGTPTEEALAAVAEQVKSSDDAVSHIVHRRKARK